MKISRVLYIILKYFTETIARRAKIYLYTKEEMSKAGNKDKNNVKKIPTVYSNMCECDLFVLKHQRIIKFKVQATLRQLAALTLLCKHNISLHCFVYMLKLIICYI